MSRRRSSKCNRKKHSPSKNRKSSTKSSEYKSEKKTESKSNNKKCQKKDDASESYGKKSKNAENLRKGAQAEKKTLICRRYQKFHDNFLKYEEIIALLQKTKKENCLNVDLVKIGNSAQGKPILMVIISGPTLTKEDQNHPKMGVMIEAGLNGSNYMAVSNALYIIDYLVKNPNCAMLVDYYIIPCSHPDGYSNFLNSQNEGKNESRHDRCHNKGSENRNQGPQQSQRSVMQMDLTNNFPVLLGLNDMKQIDNQLFLEKIKIWKENYIARCPEQLSILGAIYSYQFALKMFISLQEEGEQICFPFGFCKDQPVDIEDLVTIAKKGVCVMNCRNFQYGSMYNLQGLTYGSLVDFLKIEKLPIKFLYTIQVNKHHRKSEDSNTKFKNDVRKILQYGGEIMSCLKVMTCAVYKFYNKPIGKKVVQDTAGINKNLY